VIDGTRFALFVSAAAILALTPGPGILYVWEELSTAEDVKASCPPSGPLSGAQSTSWLQDWDSPRS
jgi:hypothetical protein